MAGQLARYASPICRAVAYLVSFLVTAPFFYHVANGSNSYVGLLEDDHFYYTVIANNLVALGKLSYDGAIVTNGFHPLWLGVVVVLRLLCGGLGDSFYVALAFVALASMILTYELSLRFARLLGTSVGAASVIAVIGSLGTAQLLTTGMECTVAVPAFLWLLIEIARGGPTSFRRALKLGFIASLAVLARLDIAIAVAMMLGGFMILARPSLAEVLRVGAGFCLGGFLVPAYALFNFAIFSSVLPVSALAKSLQTAFGLNILYARNVALSTVYGPMVAVVLPIGLVAFITLLLRRSRMERSIALWTGGLAIVFAFTFFGLNALKSWIFFGWYAYPIAAAVIASLAFAWMVWGEPIVPTRARILVATLMVTGTLASGIRYFIEHGPLWSTNDNSLFAASLQLADLMRARDGRFAMGAIGGIMTYALNKPVVQLEGLVEDRRMIEHIRNQDDLGDVLREYNVDYLIVSVAHRHLDQHDGCYVINQPTAEWAGLRTSQMTGTICAEPIVSFKTESAGNSWSVFPSIETMVWELRSAKWLSHPLNGASSIR
ncbi:hypothetical protein AYJ54_22030 [Bradyrhizobium centrolobii]|uniref:Glycosyltransferase RgtA/B/C/D-like domain-containing protein n=2 Tax=Bradyrhizobium centrolobii TaxID=1505087 RepID=A0A176YGV3_9BRAD|nr:hypothetical protein AYJ54_22030 [Bradyrhizobium centrolobii]